MLAPILTPSALTLFTAEELRAQSIIDHSEDDALLLRYQNTALEYLQKICNRSMLRQSVNQSFSELSECIVLPFGQAQSLTSVSYYDADNIEQPFNGFVLLGEGHQERIWTDQTLPTTYRRPDAVSIEYEAGWTVDDFPAPLSQAVCLLVDHYHTHRSAVGMGNELTTIPFGVKALVSPYRRPEI